MIPLLVATVASALFQLTMRHAQRQRCNLAAVGAINYIMAFGCYALKTFLDGWFLPSLSTWIIGVLAGVVYVLAYFLILSLMRLKGLSISAGLLRLSVLVPVLCSIVIWDEKLSLLRTLGLTLALIALLLLSMDGRGRSGGELTWRILLLLGGCLLVTGMTAVGSKAFQESGHYEERYLYFLILFAVAAFVSSGVWFNKRSGTTRKDFVPGIGLGLCNIFANLLVLAALQRLPGIVVFPIYSALGLLFTSVFAIWVWKESPGRLGKMGIAVTLLATVFINM
jgi:drug/metabolite transporter (DMT)-like permease